MRLNKEQKEGLAKVFDNIATALFVAVSVGYLGFGSATVTLLNAVLGYSYAIWLVCMGLIIRGQKESTDE